MINKDVIRETVHICELISNHNLDKARLDKGHNKTHWDNYYNFIVPALKEFQSRHNNLTPNKILSRFFKDYIEKKNLGEEFNSSHFHIAGRLINSYFWGCIHKNHSESPQYKYMPQLYIVINRHGIKFGFDYGNDAQQQEPTVQKVITDDALQAQIFEILQKDSNFFMYSEMIASNSPEAFNKLEIKDRTEVGKVWNENIHIIKSYSLADLTDDIGDKILETFDVLLDIFKKISLIDTQKTEKVEYWLYAPGESARFWEEFYTESVMGIGWDYLGNLSNYKTKEEIITALKKHKDDSRSHKNDASACYDFVYTLRTGDVIIAKKGRKEYLGYGVVNSEYIYDETRPEYKNIRKVNWLKKGHWQATDHVIVAKTLTDITKYTTYVKELINLIDIDLSEITLQMDYKPQPTDTPISPFSIEDAISDLFIDKDEFMGILNLFKSKKNLILQGPPGVGKTFFAKKLAHALIDAKDGQRVKMIQFHQSYSYEDFIQGYRPTEEGHFVLKDGVFFEFCQLAAGDIKQKTYVFIIDEINRGNLSKIFGEVMLLIESDKRSKDWAIPLTYKRENGPIFFVPDNLYLLGLMNTADRSLAMVDYALRRRFKFIDLIPRFQHDKFKNLLRSGGATEALINKIIIKMTNLNEKIGNDNNLGTGYKIGHSFFCPDNKTPIDDEWYASIIKSEIAPLLKEYWFDSPEKADKEINQLLD